MEQVIFCGENPEVRLYRDDTMTAFASYWWSAYSPHGQGQVLFLWATPDVQPVIYAENEALARFLGETLVQHFDGLQAFGFDRLIPKQARFVRGGDSRRNYRVLCYDDRDEIEVVWQDIFNYRLPRLYSNIFERSEQETQYDVSNVICPVASARIIVNGTPLPGQVNSYHDGTMQRSSAFLAFSETWIERTEG